ncbi:Hemin uptake protein HemP [Franzmannia pantelleriensis]|uniref:Hemin uptake protein HemP n=1 Tax=Franzmannia pantelleriensis TaxID=48727 RepID=A0A1G9GX10_9GAMM|nr:hemin uptake protein HemP [Halomonas pantelleriensis]SDL05122.1 Hemin uptake protein HemP [Halomonas pantelleriensis]
MTSPRTPSADAPSTRPQSSGRVSSQQLLGERGLLIIEHRGKEYQLRITRNDKLILTS